MNQFPTVQETIFLFLFILSFTILIVYVVHILAPKNRNDKEKLIYDLGTLVVRFVGLLISATLAYLCVSQNIIGIAFAILASYASIIALRPKI